MHSTRPLTQFATEMRDWIRRALEPGAPPLPFGDLALRLFALQFEHNAPYRRWCETRHATPANVTDWRHIPAVSAASFKDLELTCLPADEQVAVFHSSGTTAQRPSRHFHSHESLALYETSLTSWFKTHLLPRSSRGNETPFINRSATGERAGIEVSLVTSTATDRGEAPRLFENDFVHFLALSPSPALAPHSSLVHMFATVQREFGHGAPRYFGALDETGAWALDLPALTEELNRTCNAGLPVILLGTAFSFVHLLDALAERDTALALPAGSRVMETGGYKGRSRELPKAELHRAITARLGISATHIVCEYGMSELSSQAYAGWGGGAALRPSRVSPELTWLDGVSPHQGAFSAPSHSSLLTHPFHFPPWARAIVISPETGQEVANGEAGLLRILDLANVWSVLAIQTEDLAVRRGDGFELLGRAATAEPRGCSLMATA